MANEQKSISPEKSFLNTPLSSESKFPSHLTLSDRLASKNNLRLLCIDLNFKNNPLTEPEIRRILSAYPEEFDAIVICAQEEKTTQHKSLFKALLNSFDTELQTQRQVLRTPPLGQISLSIMSKHPITDFNVETYRSSAVKQRFSKGGIVAHVSIAGKKLTLGTGHAHAQSAMHRAKEHAERMSIARRMNSNAFVRFDDIDDSPLILMGDENERNVRNLHIGALTRLQFVSPWRADAPGNPTKRIALSGLYVKDPVNSFKGRNNSTQAHLDSAAQMPNKKDRRVGKLNVLYAEGGPTDVLLTQGVRPSFIHTKAVHVESSDHEAICAALNVDILHDENLKRQREKELIYKKNFILNSIYPIFEILDERECRHFTDLITDMRNAPLSKNVLEQFYNYFYRIKQLAEYSEVFRLEGDVVSLRATKKIINDLTWDGVVFFRHYHQIPTREEHSNIDHRVEKKTELEKYHLVKRFTDSVTKTIRSAPALKLSKSTAIHGVFSIGTIIAAITLTFAAIAIACSPLAPLGIAAMVCAGYGIMGGIHAFWKSRQKPKPYDALKNVVGFFNSHNPNPSLPTITDMKMINGADAQQRLNFAFGRQPA